MKENIYIKTIADELYLKFKDDRNFVSLILHVRFPCKHNKLNNLNAEGELEFGILLQSPF